METKITSPAVKGIIISLVLIVYSLVMQFSNQSQNKSLGSLAILLFIGGIIWAGVSYAKQMNANVTYGNVFSHSFKAVAAVTVIMIIFTIISTKFLFPETVDLAMENAREQMEKNGTSEEQMEQAMAMSKKFFIPFAIGGVLLIYMITGAIAALIGSAVAKKNPQDPFVQQG